jgi:hypothetical protein
LGEYWEYLDTDYLNYARSGKKSDRKNYGPDNDPNDPDDNPNNDSDNVPDNDSDS